MKIVLNKAKAESDVEQCSQIQKNYTKYRHSAPLVQSNLLTF